VLTPVAWIGSPLLVVLGVALMPLTAAVDFVDRRSWRFTRLLALGAAFCGFEFAALSASCVIWIRWRRGRAMDSYQKLLAWWLGGITAAMRTCLNLSFDVRFPETGDRPLVVLSRHAGPGDALFLMDVLANFQGREIRAIGKEKLLWDPFFHHVATRAGFVFISDRDPAGREVIRDSAAMAPRGAFISFPEGGNFTTNRRHEAVARLRSDGVDAKADRAAELRHLLLPRPGGVHAALLGAPESAVVFVGHSGYDDIASLGSLWRAIPERRAIRVEARLVPRPPGWEDRDIVRRWLLECWNDMDRWIRKHAESSPRPGRDPVFRPPGSEP
jgi:1-acyl-sn-glycerol-3-phosphate acyltransferase